MKRVTNRSFRGRTAILVLLVALTSLGLAGCFSIKRPITVSRPGTSTPTPRPTQDSQVAAAEAAFARGDIVRAEQLANSLSTRPDLSGDDARRVWRVLAVSAQANLHPHLSLTALERWKSVQADADSLPEWQQTWSAAIAQLPAYEARPRAQAVVADASRPWPMRGEANIALAAGQWNSGDTSGALSTLQAFYAEADTPARAVLERRLFEELHKADLSTIEKMTYGISGDREAYYPYALVRLEEVRRLAQDPQTASIAAEELERLRANTRLADPSIFAAWAAPARDISVTPIASGKTIVLALPMGGQFGNLSAKIVQGAEVATREFAGQGHHLNLVTINTDEPGWVDRIAQLPADATVVGGSLRAADLGQAAGHGITGSRAFFSFLPRLTDQEEGRAAWRFFPSPEDQMEALFRLTRELGITSYAILMPDNDAYAERMADMFTQYASRFGGTVVTRAVYPSSQPETWNTFVANFLGTNRSASRAPSVPFQAIFLPDSWKTMEGLIPNLFYYRERRQALLGTMLWEQELGNLTVPVDARYYNLTAFPGGWRMKSPTPAGEALNSAMISSGQGKADFWTGLGYDFARFAARLDVPAGWTPEMVNAQLATMPDMAWSIAPIRWDGHGRASQELFLFRPESDGYAPVDRAAFRQAFDNAWGGMR